MSGISAISGVSSSSTYTSSIQALSEETRSKLENLSIDTSNIKTETQGQTALKEAQSSDNNNSSQNTTDAANKTSTLMASQGNAQQPPWISLMEQLGISPTGSIDGDKTAVNAAISNLEPQEAESLAQNFQAIGLSVETPQNAQQMDAFAGQNQIAELNKIFLINKRTA